MSDTSSPTTRVERDSLGEVEVPTAAYYGVQTVRAIRNFPITGWPPHPLFVEATVLVKKAAAITNKALEQLDAERSDAIVRAADEVLGGALRDQWRGGARLAGAGAPRH